MAATDRTRCTAVIDRRGREDSGKSGLNGRSAELVVWTLSSAALRRANAMYYGVAHIVAVDLRCPEGIDGPASHRV